MPYKPYNLPYKPYNYTPKEKKRPLRTLKSVRRLLNNKYNLAYSAPTLEQKEILLREAHNLYFSKMAHLNQIRPFEGESPQSDILVRGIKKIGNHLEETKNIVEQAKEEQEDKKKPVEENNKKIEEENNKKTEAENNNKTEEENNKKIEAENNKKTEEENNKKIEAENNKKTEEKQKTEKIDIIIGKIDIILKDFSDKAKKIGQNYPMAKTEAENLHDSLIIARNQYAKALRTGNAPDPEANKNFKKSCEEAIAKAMPILQRDLGWGEYLKNLLKSIVNALFYLATVGNKNSFFSYARSEISQEAILTKEKLEAHDTNEPQNTKEEENQESSTSNAKLV